MSNVFVLKIRNEVQELDRIFQTVEELAEQEGWPPALTFKVNLVLEEMGLNVITHGLGPSEGGQEFDITLTSEPSILTIEITDPGRPFNPLKDAPLPSFDTTLADRAVGGLGIHLVKELTESLQYRRENSLNCSKIVIRKSE